MRFLADMGISPGTVRFLRDQGHDALHLHEQDLDRLPDSAILEKAQHESRVLLAHDLDFGEILASSGATLPSVVVFRLRDMRPERVNRYLSEIIAYHGEDFNKGAIISVAEGRVRVRVLPLPRRESVAGEPPKK